MKRKSMFFESTIENFGSLSEYFKACITETLPARIYTGGENTLFFQFFPSLSLS